MAKTVHVVMRHNWRKFGRGGWRLVPGMVRLASFATAELAQADLARREANVRRWVNPFSCGPLARLTSLPEGVFFDLLADHGLEPPTKPKKGERDWVGWWASVPAEKRPALWQALDRLKFYEVVERPAGAVAYALLTPNWHYNDEFNYMNDEGGTVQAVYRTRERAEEEGRKSHAYLSDDGVKRGHLPAQLDPFDPEDVYRAFLEDESGFEVVEIELEGVS
jgi:hypothetical protein